MGPGKYDEESLCPNVATTARTHINEHLCTGSMGMRTLLVKSSNHDDSKSRDNDVSFLLKLLGISFGGTLCRQLPLISLWSVHWPLQHGVMVCGPPSLSLYPFLSLCIY